MGRIKRSFDLAFKVRVAEAIENGAKTVLAVCQEYQLQRQTVERWLNQYVSGEFEARSKRVSREMELERERDKLRAKVGELTMQLDALKKTAFSPPQSRRDNSWIISSKNSDPEIRLADPSGFLGRPTTPVESVRTIKNRKKTRT